MTQTASDRPWIASRLRYSFHDAHNNYIGLTTRPEDAEHIVRCVNGHDKLLKICRAVAYSENPDTNGPVTVTLLANMAWRVLQEIGE